MAKSLNIVFLLCAVFVAVFAKHEIYDGHSLYEVKVRNAHEAELVTALEHELAIDILTRPQPARAGHILVSKELKPTFESILASNNVEYNIQVHNIREQLELEDQLLAAAAARNTSRTSTSPRLSWNTIHRHFVVDNYLLQLALANPDTVSIASHSSALSRSVTYLRISTTNFEDHSKPVMFIMSLLNAREWVSLAASLYAIEKLVIDVQERDLLETMDWIILPIANPDGYEFTHDFDRFWIKSRSIVDPDNICFGVKLNMNFGTPFWATDTSNIPCAENYPGPFPDSEPETMIIRNIFTRFGSRMAFFADIHSYGSQIHYGYGHGVLPSNALSMHISARQQALAIDRVKWSENPNYTVGNTASVRQVTSGSAVDYATQIGVPFAYAYELPAYRSITDFPILGYLVDPQFIRQAGMETWEGIKTGARHARDMFLRKQTLR